MSSARSTPDDVRVVVPIRSFAEGKARLAERLDAEQRLGLARLLATRVVAAAAPHPVTVVTSASEVLTWALEHALDVLADPGRLDDAVAAGVARARATGARRVVVAHADLPLVESFAPVLAPPDDHVVLVPDRSRDGTPVLVVPEGCDLAFAYGPGSFDRHVAAARRTGRAVTIVDDPRLGTDVDLPEDLVWVAPAVRLA